MKAQIKETAIVIDCKIGAGTIIWNFANIYGCTIGEDCNIGSYTEIQNDVNIGDNVTISSHSFICSLTTIEDNVFIGHGVMTINDLHPPSFEDREPGLRYFVDVSAHSASLCRQHRGIHPWVSFRLLPLRL